MTNAPEPSEQDNDNDYLLGHTDTEKVRLIEQDRLFTRAMGGLLAEQTDISHVRQVLDVACGPGGWALELAERYPHLQVVGIDIDAGMIEYARAMAHVGRLGNVSFFVMDATKPLDFPTATFDLVNSRFMSGFMTASQWPLTLAEFLRVGRNGAIIRVTETEWSGTNSLGLEESQARANMALHSIGRSFVPYGSMLGTTARLGRLLRQTGCIDVQETAYAIDFSAGTPIQQALYQVAWVAHQHIQSFLVKIGFTTPEEADKLISQLQNEMLADEFFGIFHMLTAWGHKA